MKGDSPSCLINGIVLETVVVNLARNRPRVGKRIQQSLVHRPRRFGGGHVATAFWSRHVWQIADEFVERDRVMPHPNAGCIVDRVGDGGRHAA